MTLEIMGGGRGSQTRRDLREREKKETLCRSGDSLMTAGAVVVVVVAAAVEGM